MNALLKRSKKLCGRLKPYDQLHTCLPNSLLVFKELRLPFREPEKIRMALPFEIEGLLPFPVTDALFDFIITHESPDTAETQILVAAAQKSRVAEHLALFESAGLSPNIITVDFFALYALYRRMPEKNKNNKGVILLSLDTHTTRIAYIRSQSLRLIRTINQGITHVARSIAQELSQDPGKALERLLRFGTTSGDEQADTVTREALTHWWQSVELTLASFEAQDTTPPELLLLGTGAGINGINSFIEQQLGHPCNLISRSTLTTAQIAVARSLRTISPAHVISAATALPPQQTGHFNLRRGEFEREGTGHLFKQLIAIASLSLVIIVLFTTHLIIQQRTLSRDVAESQAEAITELSQQFPRLEEEQDLESMVEEARGLLRQKQELWSKFSHERSFAHYLIELTNRIDGARLGFVPERIAITSDAIFLSGRVRDHEALAQLERSLEESKLFKHIARQSNPEFSGMKITLATPGGRS